MDTKLLEVVSQIIEEGSFKKSTKSDSTLKTGVEKLFRLHKEEKTEDSAKRVYHGIVELAKLGKGGMANKMAMRFEEEIGYEDF
jgi:hypothetical protein